MIGVELQGRGRTTEIDRDSTPAALAGDVVALLDHLGIGRAHALGFSLSAAVTSELSISHSDRVRSVVPTLELADQAPDAQLDDQAPPGHRQIGQPPQVPGEHPT